MYPTTGNIYKRRSVRSFKRTPILDDDLKFILSSGLSAPSGEGIHPLEMIVIKSDEAKAKIKSFYEWAEFCVQSPVSVLVCYDKDKIPAEYDSCEDLGKLDAAAAIQNMLLRATDLGIASCWTHALENAANYRDLCKLPENIVPVALIVLGYSDIPFESRDGFDVAKIHNEIW
ncbi:MAG: nitroreductase family protein [Rickettsiales bacterium]|jgi:nitroreductase|nr:nitroreductase family protein [Rickettsiales bacterium]